MQIKSCPIPIKIHRMQGKKPIEKTAEKNQIDFPADLTFQRTQSAIKPPVLRPIGQWPRQSPRSKGK
jgi:hypothetical protein